MNESRINVSEGTTGAQLIVVNGEEQYSIWPAERDLPAGWRVVERRNSREECLERIETLWTDIRPKSVRDRIKGASE